MQIAVVTSGFPRRSETFALHEVVALQEAGMLARVFATKPGDGLTPHPDFAHVRAPVSLLPAGTVEEQGEAIARELRGERIAAIHAYFAHAPAAVAAAASRSLHVPYGFSVHARDARKVTRRDLARRAAAARCVVACNEDVAREVPLANGRLTLVPHGVDLRRFAASQPPGRDVLRILAVGRLVEKKGFEVLIDAAERLNGSVRVRIVGDGPEGDRLRERITRRRLALSVSLVPGRAHDALPQEYADADIVVAPSVHDRTGDRDGLPNVVLEAMASARPVVATRVGAIASAVEHGSTGLLVAPGDAAALARAIDRFVRNPALRNRAGRAGRMKAEREFSLAECTARFVRVLEQAYA
jgi:glycosyltransferase involved in cell wall biosynthesis